MKTYEAMFLMDPAKASEWSVIEEEMRRILDRAGAEVIGLKNWNERRLAYDIRGLKRGVYALAFFRAEPDRIAGVERDVQLSEKVVRALVVRREKMTSESIEKVLAAAPPVKSAGRHEDEYEGPRRDGHGPRRRFRGPPRGGDDEGPGDAPPRRGPRERPAESAPADESGSGGDEQPD